MHATRNSHQSNGLRLAAPRTSLALAVVASATCLAGGRATAQSCFSTSPYAVGAEPSCVVMADVSGDGLNDLIVANHDLALDNRISVLLNNGDGTFAPSVYYNAGDRPYWIAHGDIDGDLDLDVAVTNYFDTTVSIYLNNGDGSLAPQITYDIGNGPGFVVLARLDGDADLDLAATNITDDTVSILLNNGDGTFAPQSTFASGPGPYGLIAVDLDGDTLLDLAACNHHSNTMSVLLGNGDGTFDAPAAYIVDAGPVGCDARDLDSDGDLDMAVANTNQAATGTTISVLMNNGDGTFAAHTPYPAAVGPYTLKIADFNSDGFGDLTAAHESGFASIMLNNGDGTFAPAVDFPVGLNPVGLDVGDLDGNGTPEVAVTCYGADEIWVLFNEYVGITQQPVGVSVVPGAAAVFSVVAGGPEPFTYKWRRDGVELADGGAISGALTDTLTIDPVDPTDAGAYDVIVANDCGSVETDDALLEVTPPACVGDIVPLPSGDHIVNVADLLAVITSWGPCGDCSACPADIAPAPPAKHDCTVNVADLLSVITHWGACP